MYDGQEELDNLVWDKNDEDSEKALKQMQHKYVRRNVEKIAEAKFDRPATLVVPLEGMRRSYPLAPRELTEPSQIALPRHGPTSNVFVKDCRAR